MTTPDRRTALQMLLLAAGGLAAGTGRAAAGRAIVSKIALVEGRVVCGIKIDGHGPYLFMIDTGGFLSLINDDLAREISLQRRGATGGRGVGGAAILPLYIARDVVFGGGATQKTVAFAGLARPFGADVRGALAAGMLTAADSDLDIEAGEWRTYPEGRGEWEGTRLPDAIRGGGPAGAGSPRLFGSVEVDGRVFRMLLDTGAPGGFALDAAAGRALGLTDDTRPWAPARPRGIGGVEGVARIVRAGRASFGGALYERPLVTVRDARLGGDQDGVVGLAVLRGFNLSTEVRAKALWVKRHDSAPPLDDRYGLSGLWIDDVKGRVTVAAVGTGSPAAGAGVQAGDAIVGLSFPDALRAINGRPGKEVTVTLERGGARRDARFTLRPFLD
jgi:hypothetical protein